MLKKHGHIDHTRDTFAKVLAICFWIGLGITVLFGAMYLFGVHPSVDAVTVVQSWDKPITQFWLSARGEEYRGYAWLLDHRWGMDSLAMTGILLLALTPLIALLFIIWRTRGLYLVLLLILVVEFLFSVFWPLI